MVDLSRPWPLGIGQRRWWIVIVAALLLFALVLTVDRPVSVWAQSWPAWIRDALAQVTPYGESAWILIPTAVLFVVTALVALVVRWRLMRTMLWQFTVLYAFILVGVGLPSLFTTLAKRLIGRGRPMHFDETGLLGLHPNLFDWSYQSFPSGHATTAFALAAVVGFLSERWFYPALVFAGIVALSRVTEGVHYPTDVLGGAIVGLLGAYFVRSIFAERRWMFVHDDRGRIIARSLTSLSRYLTLKRRSSARARMPNQP
ncbi:MAG: phosphatase PAP2 family protein [Devosia sp.]